MRACYARIHFVITRGRRRQTLGLTMAELFIAMALLALGAAVVGQAFTNMRSSRVYVRSEAEQVAELLRSLRQQAITQGRPVGLGIPSQGGTRAASDGYYLLEGERRPKVVRRVVMDGDRAIQISGCYWPELAFGPPPTGAFSNSSYTLADWEAPYPQDGLIMFLPSGEMLTNLPTFQGEAALVLGYAVQVSGAALGNLLQGAKGPVVVWVSVLGEVRLEGGISGAPGRVNEAAVGSAMGVVPPLSSNSNGNPSFVTITGQVSPLQMSPPANPNTLGTVAPGNTGTLRRKRYVSLKVTASDPDGDALTCAWTSGGNSGAFTKKDDVRMHYDPTLKVWVATWAWHPPDGATGNQQFSLEATVRDGRGGSATLSGAISGGGTFRILTPGKLAFTRGNDTWMSNWDGSDPVIVAYGMERPRWGRGSSMICCNKVGTGDLFICSPDGRSQELIYTASGYTSAGSFNHRGNRVLFAVDSGGVLEIKQVDPWGGNLGGWNYADPGLLPSPTTRPVVDCHPNDDTVVVSHSVDGAGPHPIVIIHEDDSVPDETLLVEGYDASFTRDGNSLVYRTVDGRMALYRLGDPAPATSAPMSSPRLPRMSNDGNYGVFQANDGSRDNCFIFFDGAGLSQPQKLFDFPEPCGHPDWAE